MSDTERNEQRRLQFLRTVYDLANDTQSRRVRGVDVAERLGLDLNGEEFHDLARYHREAGNIEAIETNWGLLALTDKGKAKVESHAMPISVRMSRDTLQKLTEMSEKWGMDTDEARQLLRNLVEKRPIESRTDEYGILSITAEGVDEVEGGEPTPQTWGDVLYGSRSETNDLSVPEQVPPAIRESLPEFRKDHPDPARVAFILMQFGETKAHERITTAIKDGLDAHGIVGVRADEKEYNPFLFPNVQTYLHGCGLGVAVFERIEAELFNPNVSLEVGYMLAMDKPVCLLKDMTLTTLPADLVGSLYREFDPQDPTDTIPANLSRWLTDRGLSQR